MLPAFSKEQAAAEIGITTGVIEGWMKRYWTNGVEYVVIGRTTLIYREELEKWLNGLRESDREAMASRYEFGSTANSRTPRQFQGPGKVPLPTQLNGANS